MGFGVQGILVGTMSSIPGHVSEPGLSRCKSSPCSGAIKTWVLTYKVILSKGPLALYHPPILQLIDVQYFPAGILTGT